MATQIFEAVIDENGVLQFMEPRRFPQGTKAMVTIIEPEVEQKADAFTVILHGSGDKRIPSVRVVRDGDSDRLANTFDMLEDAETQFTLPELKPGAVYKMATPRLTDPAQARLFRMEMTEATDDARV